MQLLDKEIIFALVAISSLLILFAGFIIIFVFIYNRKKAIHLKTLEDQKILFKEEALRAEMEIKEETLRHISEEIHDNIGQMMLVSKMNLNKMLLTHTGQEKRIEETREIIGDAIDALRDLSHSLHPDHLVKKDLVEALENELNRIQKTGLVITKMKVEGDPYLADVSQKIILYRMFQEIIQNALKHSNCTEIALNLKYRKDHLYLIIIDNGEGFIIPQSLEGEKNERGTGLTNLQNRAQALKGQLKIESEPGNGTKISIKIPV